MNSILKEVFGDIPTYMMGIAFETYTHDEDLNSKVKRKGWEVPYTEADASEIDAYATKYMIPGRTSGDSRKHWETEEPFKDGMTGDETYYILHVKNLDGSDISFEQFHEINEKLIDETGNSWGIQRTTPRPLVMNW